MTKAFFQLLLLTVISVANVFPALADGPDPLLGAWRYRNERGEAVSMVIIHQCELTSGDREICHVEVAHLTPGKAPGHKRVALHLAINREKLQASIVDRPRKALSFYPEGYGNALAVWRREAGLGKPEICEEELYRCLMRKTSA